MEKSIKSRLLEAWIPTGLELRDLIADTVSGLGNLLKLEEQRVHGHEEDRLQRALGPFAAGNMDLNALSGILRDGRGAGSSAKKLDAEREGRIKELVRTLEARLDAYATDPPRPVFISLEEPLSTIEARVDRHLASLASLFKQLHSARLLIRARYDPEIHDAFFADFRWHQLSPAELQLCPPFLVLTACDDSGGAFEDSVPIQKITALLGSRKPLKIVALRSRLNKIYPPAISPIIPATPTFELLPLFLRGVFAVQTSLANERFEELLRQGITASRPALISLLWDEEADEQTLRSRSERAIVSRAFPSLVYDPDSAEDFASCFDLSANPELEATWGTLQTRPTDNGDGKRHPYTFVDFALAEAEFEGSFKELPSDTPGDSIVPLFEYLTLNRIQRIGKTPYVDVLERGPEATEVAVRKVPSLDLITQTSDVIHRWRTMQELAGINHPQVAAMLSRARSRSDAQHENELNALRKDLGQQMRAREIAAVAYAIRNLTAHLTGIDPDTVAMERILAAAADVEIPSDAKGDDMASSGGMASTPRTETSRTGDEEASDISGQTSIGDEHMTTGDEQVTTGSEASSTAPAPIRPPGDGPWIESELCTTCDDCITLNDRIFAYNEDKKAYIKNPKGGPFSDIVKAAEKCTAGIIHPGKPLDPAEKDLEKWVKRAEKFQ